MQGKEASLKGWDYKARSITPGITTPPHYSTIVLLRKLFKFLQYFQKVLCLINNFLFLYG